MANVVQVLPARIEDDILSVVVSAKVREKVASLYDDLFCIGETEESIRLKVLVGAGQNKCWEQHSPIHHPASMEQVWAALQEHNPSIMPTSPSLGLLFREAALSDQAIDRPTYSISGRWKKFEQSYVLPECDRYYSQVPSLLEAAFRTRLSVSTRRRLEELDNGDQRFPCVGGQLEIKITKKKLKHLLNLSDTLFRSYERDEFLPEIQTDAMSAADGSGVSRDVDSVLTVGEASDFMKLSETIIRRNIKRGTIPYFRVGKRYLLSRPALENWIADKIVRPGVEQTPEEFDETVHRFMAGRKGSR